MVRLVQEFLNASSDRDGPRRQEFLARGRCVLIFTDMGLTRLRTPSEQTSNGERKRPCSTALMVAWPSPRLSDSRGARSPVPSRLPCGQSPFRRDREVAENQSARPVAKARPGNLTLQSCSRQSQSCSRGHAKAAKNFLRR